MLIQHNYNDILKLFLFL